MTVRTLGKEKKTPPIVIGEKSPPTPCWTRWSLRDHRRDTDREINKANERTEQLERNIKGLMRAQFEKTVFH